MRVCLMIEGQESVTWEEWLDLAKACEDSAIDALFRSDHYQSVMGKSERSSLDAWATICGLAAVTSTLRLGTLVSPVTFRHPSVLAKNVVTADHISGGGRIGLRLARGRARCLRLHLLGHGRASEDVRGADRDRPAPVERGTVRFRG